MMGRAGPAPWLQAEAAYTAAYDEEDLYWATLLAACQRRARGILGGEQG